MTRPSRSRLILLLLAALVPTASRKAHAWTEARVTTAAATVSVDGSGAAEVDLELGLSIDAGWLEGLEIAGLDSDLVLDPAHTVMVVSEEGERFTPAVRPLSDGRVLLSFTRRDAPRRGHYRTRLRYHTELGGRKTSPTGHGTVRFEWTLPGWQSGLDGVSIQIVAPRGATLPADEIQTSTIRSDVREGADGTLLTFRRAHLPRTLPWTIAFEVPESEVVPSLHGPRAHAELPPPRVRTEREPGFSRGLELLIGLFALVGLAKRAAYERAARLRGASVRPLVPLSRLPHALAVLLAAGAALWLGRRGSELFPLALIAIVLVSLQRPVAMSAAPRLGAYRPVTPEHLRRARRARSLDVVAPLRCLDASQPLGIVTTLASLGLVFRASAAPDQEALAFTAAHGAVLFAALMLTSPAARIPASPESRLHALARLAQKIRVPLDAGASSMALRLLVHEDAEGRAQDARLRVCTESRPEGLIRFDVLRLERDGLGGHRGSHALLVVTRAGSPAERIVARVLPKVPVQRAPAGRRARIASLETDLSPLLAAMTTAAGEASPVRPMPRRTETSPSSPLVAEGRLAS